MQKLMMGEIAATALFAANPAPAMADVPVADKAATAITVTGALDQLVTYNTTASVAFTVKADGRLLPRRAVQVCTAPAVGDWLCVATTTSSSGRVMATQKKVVAPARMRLVVPENATTGAATSDTISVRPQVGVTVSRSRTTMTVSLNVADNQYLVIRRQEGTKWVLDGFPQQVAGAKTVLSDLVIGKRYQVTVSDTATVRGATSRAV